MSIPFTRIPVPITPFMIIPALIALVLLAGCSSSRPAADTGTEDPVYTENPFYYDDAHHVMLRIGAEPQPGLLNRYNRYLEEHPWQAYRFWQDDVLGLETAFDRIVYTMPEFAASGYQAELIDRPVPVYPKKKPLAGRVLIVEVSMIIDPDGRVEFAELANIRRNENEPESRLSTALNGETPKWTGSRLHELDLPYIRHSLENAVAYVFRPVQFNGQPVRFNVIVSYIYEADKLNRTIEQ
ncbi:MAG: hypothetical protein EA364_03370 [Balneolaceae bacterium]|nr:MAG: hypothetical protein EA364_03370 [Balneolaceae bacterium]